MPQSRPQHLPLLILERMAPKPWFSAVMRIVMVPVDRWLLRLSRGRVSSSGATSAYALLLTTTGWRSGRARTTPLFYLRHDGGFLVTASNFGRSEHPAWSSNLLNNPQALITVGNHAIPVVARLLHGAERARAWQAVADLSPVYQHYDEISARTFRLFSLAPVGPGTSAFLAPQDRP